MINKLKRLSQSKFARNVAIVATGTAGAQAITMVFAPLITRFYGPEAFGILGTFTAILAVLAPIAALSYPIAIVLPKREADAVGLAKLSIRIALVTSLLTALLLWLFKASIVQTLSLQTVEPFIMLLPLAMFFSAAMAIMSQWLIRKRLFKITARVAVLQALWINSAKAGVGFFFPVAAVLVMLGALGSALHAFMLWVGVRKSQDGRMASVIKEDADADSRELAWRHRDFAYYRTPQIVLNAASQSMPVLMLASFFGPASAGFYALGKMVLGVPTALIGQSVASVFYPRINEAVHKGEDAHNLLVKATYYLAALGAIPFGIVVFFGPWIFGFVFGEEWSTAGIYAQWLALWSYFGFMNRPSVGAIPVFSMQRLFLFYEVVSIGLRAAALTIGFVVFESALIAVAMFSLVSVFLNLILIISTVFTAKTFKTRRP